MKSFQLIEYFYLYLRPGIIIISVCGGERPEQEAELPRALGGSHQEVHRVLQHHPRHGGQEEAQLYPRSGTRNH